MEAPMELRDLMIRAVDATLDVVQGVQPDRFGSPTPCPEFDVRRLLCHLVAWMGEPSLAAATKQQPSGPPDDERDVTAEPGWAERFAATARAAAVAWSEPAAWEGSTSLSGTQPMPASFVGGLVYGEYLLHGWDLAVATGGKLVLDDELAEALLAQLSVMADTARQYNAFGPEVPVPASAPPLDRALGLAGRDPSWTA
jgi:uncharacterized protein (TIGR03086 family)